MIKYTSTKFLIILHSIILLIFCIIGSGNLFGWIYSLIEYFILLSFSLIFQLIIYLIIRKKNISTIYRIVIFFLPLIIIYFILFHLPIPQKINQITPLMSKSGKYKLEVGTTKGIWKIKIFSDNQKIYEDNDSNFCANFNAYWIWDSNDRVWIYNSDTSEIYYWELISDKWIKTKWGYSHTKEIEENIFPPNDLYPEYEKNIMTKNK